MPHRIRCACERSSPAYAPVLKSARPLLPRKKQIHNGQRCCQYALHQPWPQAAVDMKPTAKLNAGTPPLVKHGSTHWFINKSQVYPTYAAHSRPPSPPPSVVLCRLVVCLPLHIMNCGLPLLLDRMLAST